MSDAGSGEKRTEFRGISRQIKEKEEGKRENKARREIYKERCKKRGERLQRTPLT